MGDRRHALAHVLKTSRPYLWPVMPICFLGGLLVAHARVSLVAGLQAFALSFPMSLFLYGVNDIHDYASDRINRRKIAGEAGTVAEERYHGLIRIAGSASAAFVLLAAALAGSVVGVLLTVMLLGIAYSYSAPPVRLKTRPPLDSLVNAVLYVIVPGAIGYGYSGTLRGFPVEVLYVGLCLSAVHAILAVADHESDRQAGDRTISGLLGPRATMAAAGAVLLGVMLLMLFGPRRFSLAPVNAYLLIVGLASVALALRRDWALRLSGRFALYVIYPGFLLLVAYGLYRIFFTRYRL